MTLELSSLDLVVLCGGRGTRLGAMTDQIPKPLLSIGGSPYLLRLLLHWKKEGVGRFILAAHYLADQFRGFAKEHAQQIGEVSVITEDVPLGTGGGIRNAALHVKSETFLVANGDSLVPQPWMDVVKFHDKHHAKMTIVAVRASRVVGGAKQKGMLDFTPGCELRSFATQYAVKDGWINGGMYVLNRDIVLGWPEGRSSLENEIMSSPTRPRSYIFQSEAELMDIGTPESFAMINEKFEA